MEPMPTTIKKPDLLYVILFYGKRSLAVQTGLKTLLLEAQIWRFTERGMTIPSLRCVTWGGQDAIFKHNVPGYAAHQKHARAVDVHA